MGVYKRERRALESPHPRSASKGKPSSADTGGSFRGMLGTARRWTSIILAHGIAQKVKVVDTHRPGGSCGSEVLDTHRLMPMTALVEAWNGSEVVESCGHPPTDANDGPWVKVVDTHRPGGSCGSEGESCGHPSTGGKLWLRSCGHPPTDANDGPCGSLKRLGVGPRRSSPAASLSCGNP